MDCFHCKAPLGSLRQGFNFCPQCGSPSFLGNQNSPFELLDLETRFEQNDREIQDRYYDLSRRLHPDRFAAQAPSLRMKCQELYAALNQAYTAIRDPELRLETLLRLSGALSPVDPKQMEKGQSQIPLDMAERYFELQELVLENPKAAKEQATQFETEIERETSLTTEELFNEAKALDWKRPDPNKISDILERRKRRAYLVSLRENLRRLAS